MKIIVVENYAELSKKAANIIAAQVLIKPKSVLGLATGSSPVGTYEKLIEYYKAGEVSFKDTITVNLDEYVGLPKEDEQSYHYFMRKKFYDHIDISTSNTYIPNGIAKDTDEECRNYDKIIENLGGVDLQLLGIGTNGHVAFNEPAEAISNNTYVADLTQDTIDANKRFFEKEEDVPKTSYTMGIGSLLRSRKAIMIVSGANKAEALKQTVYGDISPLVPSSLMRLHNDFTIIADKEAAAKL